MGGVRRVDVYTGSYPRLRIGVAAGGGLSAWNVQLTDLQPASHKKSRTLVGRPAEEHPLGGSEATACGIGGTN
jgi:hypothetical protein